MSSSSGPVSMIGIFPEFQLDRVRWNIIATKEVQFKVTEAIMDTFEKEGFRTTYRERDGIHIVVQINGRKPRGP